MARRSICVISMSVADTWTSCDSPLRRDASTAASDADASALPTWAAIRFMGLDSGGRGGVPLALTGPAIASATSCVAANPAYGPSSPQGVRLASTMPGWRAASASRLRPRSASSRRDRAARTRSAVTARSASSARSRRRARGGGTERHAALVAVEEAEGGASLRVRLVGRERPRPAAGVAVWLLDLDDVGAEVGEELPGERDRHTRPDLDHADLVQSLHWSPVQLAVGGSARRPSPGEGDPTARRPIPSELPYAGASQEPGHAGSGRGPGISGGSGAGSRHRDRRRWRWRWRWRWRCRGGSGGGEQIDSVICGVRNEQLADQAGQRGAVGGRQPLEEQGYVCLEAGRGVGHDRPAAVGEG